MFLPAGGRSLPHRVHSPSLRFLSRHRLDRTMDSNRFRSFGHLSRCRSSDRHCNALYRHGRLQYSFFLAVNRCSSNTLPHSWHTRITQTTLRTSHARALFRRYGSVDRIGTSYSNRSRSIYRLRGREFLNFTLCVLKASTVLFYPCKVYID
jgi:hypothetical protein